MEVYNLSFNTVVCNVKNECTSFFCPRDCKFMKTLQSDLKVDIGPHELPYQRDTICPGKVYNASPVRRLPMVYVHDTETYCDITLMSINDKYVQVIIMKHSDCPDIVDVERNYDPYKVYYEYVGGIADLKARMNYECKFIQGVQEGAAESTLEESFTKSVDELIIGSQFE